MSEQTNERPASLTTGYWVMLTLAFAYSISALWLLCGGKVNPYIFPAALVLPGIMLYGGTSVKVFFKSAMTVSGLWTAAILLAWFTFDFSYDGLSYHQEIIFDLYKGGNLYADPLNNEHLSLWSRHYAAGMETIEACLVSFTDNIEAGKAVNLLLAAATGFMVWYCTPFSTYKKLGMLVITMANPVFLGQMMTYYVDFTLYFYIVATICAIKIICRHPDDYMPYAVLSATMILAIATKFNIAFYECMAILLILWWLVLGHGIGYKPSSRIFRVSSVSVILGFLVLCYHPYVTNTLYFGNPFYPLMGDNPVDIMTGLTPEHYLESNRVANFFDSYFCFKLQSVKISVDRREGGFGPFSPILFTVSIMAIAYSCIKKRRLTAAGYISLCVFLSCFIFEQTWWARYIPQLWILVPAGYYCLAGIDGKVSLWTRRCVMTMVIITGMLGIYATITRSIDAYDRRNAIAAVIGKRKCLVYDCRPHMAWVLRQAGMNIEVVDNDTPPDPEKIVTYFFFKDFGTIAVSPEEKRLIDARIDYENPFNIKYVKKLYRELSTSK